MPEFRNSDIFPSLCLTFAGFAQLCECATGGKPSTRLPPGGLIEQVTQCHRYRDEQHRTTEKRFDVETHSVFSIGLPEIKLRTCRLHRNQARGCDYGKSGKFCHHTASWVGNKDCFSENPDSGSPRRTLDEYKLHVKSIHGHAT